MILWEEWDAAEEVAKADPDFLAALAKRAIDDPSDAMSCMIKFHGFFDRNPALNVPEAVGARCGHQA